MMSAKKKKKEKKKTQKLAIIFNWVVFFQGEVIFFGRYSFNFGLVFKKEGFW